MLHGRWIMLMLMEDTMRSDVVALDTLILIHASRSCSPLVPELVAEFSVAAGAAAGACAGLPKRGLRIEGAKLLLPEPGESLAGDLLAGDDLRR